MLMTEPSTRIVGWMWLSVFFLGSVKDCSVLFYESVNVGLEKVQSCLLFKFFPVGNFGQVGETHNGRSVREDLQFAIN